MMFSQKARRTHDVSHEQPAPAETLPKEAHTPQPGAPGPVASPQMGSIAAGMPRLVDLLAPDVVLLQRDYQYVERAGAPRFLRFLSIIPARSQRAGVLLDLYRLQLPFLWSTHLFSVESSVALKDLQANLTQIEANRYGVVLGKQVEKAAIPLAAEDTRRMMHALEAGTYDLFNASCTLCLHASSLKRLEERYQHVIRTLQRMQMRVQGCLFQQADAWHSCMPMGTDLLQRRWNTDDQGAGAWALPVHTRVGTQVGRLLGITAERTPVFYSPYSPELPNSNICCVGRSGEGKSHVLKHLTSCALFEGDTDCVAIDPHNDFLLLHEALGPEESQRIELASGCQINAFDLPFTPEDLHEASEASQDLLEEHVQQQCLPFLLLMTNTPELPIPREEESLLYQALLLTFARKKITSTLLQRQPKQTLARQAPLLGDVIDVLNSETRLGQATLQRSLASRLEQFRHYFSSPTQLTLDRPLTTFGLDRLHPRFLPLVMLSIRNFLQRNRAHLRYQRNLLYIIDEAGPLLRHPAGRTALENQVRAARKQGIAQVTCSQLPEDFSHYGTVIRDNAATFLCLGLPLEASAELGLTLEQRHYLDRAQPGDCLMRINQDYVAFHVTTSPEENRLYRTDHQEIKQDRTKQAEARTP